MEEKATIAESVLAHAKEAAKASLEIIKLKAINKGTEVGSMIAAYVLVIATTIMFLIIVNIGLALWIGELLGKLYYGFFVVAGFYLLVALIILAGRKVLITKPVTNFAIKKYLNQQKAQANHI